MSSQTDHATNFLRNRDVALVLLTVSDHGITSMTTPPESELMVVSLSSGHCVSMSVETSSTAFGNCNKAITQTMSGEFELQDRLSCEKIHINTVHSCLGIGLGRDGDNHQKVFPTINQTRDPGKARACWRDKKRIQGGVCDNPSPSPSQCLAVYGPITLSQLE